MAQQNPNVLVTGSIVQAGPEGYDEVTTLNCRGMPTCTGTYSSNTRYENCTNYYTATGTFNVTGLNLTQSGTVQGTIMVSAVGTDRLPGGVCAPGSDFHTEQLTYVGTWNLATATGSLTVTGPDGPPDVFQVNFTADIAAPAPAFPMTVRAEIGPQTSKATADINFRPEDVGRNGSVFVFASAPAARVVGGLEAKAVHLGKASKADTPCVLAQLNPQGQLVAVSTGQLEAFSTGAFAAQGASVSILNNVPTPGIAGTTFYVGYGSSGSEMLDNGIFRNAVLVPGTGACPPLPYMTSLWWNPGESGWGLNLNQQGSLMFGTLFTYDASRAPLWLVMPAGTLQADGVSFSGALYRTTGPAFNANPFNPAAVGVSQVGTMTVSFSQANAGTLTYTVNGVQVQKNIQRQVFGARSANCLPGTGARTASTHYQDLWWNPAESGWGVNLTHQDNTLFATLFTYDPSGRDVWLVLPAGARQADGSYFGDLYRTTGPAFNAIPFTAIDVTVAGTMRLRFADGNTGTLTYTYNGTTVTKAITRQEFSTPVSACN